MTGYSTAHLFIAGLCGFMALVHLGLWLVVRGDRVQLWVSISFVGFCVVNLAIAGSGRWGGGLGPPLPWILAGTAVIIPLWIGPLLTAWHMVGRPINRVRRRMLMGAAAFGVVRMADLAWFVWTMPAYRWEDALNSLGTFTVVPAWIVTIAVGAICVVESLRDLGKKSVASWVLLFTALPATALVIRELALTLGYASGPTWLGLTGLPFLFTASTIAGLRYAQAMRAMLKNAELSGYKLIRRLDAGGMGELYLASRVGPGGFERVVAVKKMIVTAKDDEDIAELTQRFLDEARLAAQLDHPNIVAVHDLGQLEDGVYFIAMEYLSGMTLSQIRDRMRMMGTSAPVQLVTAIGEQICRGLAYAHGKSVVHRDISPANVMITFRGTVKIIDFGIAIERGRRGITASGMVVGKGPYMSPERISGMAAEPPSDIYALGITLYELLLGIRPFSGKTPAEVARAIREGRFAPLRVLRPEIPEAVELVVEKALAVDASLRYRTAEAMADALLQVSAGLPPIDLGKWMKDWCGEDLREQRRVEVFAGLPRSETQTTRQFSST